MEHNNIFSTYFLKKISGIIAIVLTLIFIACSHQNDGNEVLLLNETTKHKMKVTQ